ncbi:hypothetical protein JTE90_020779 [Oedothorax gibbosus]|uniref:Uncharacterized protein n=1 Tax=Oedothorax gibbosus TaxID=931172 RepID=A0AAV6TX02_9ARAC|nr:hypothetical protein JTE90_020779 [Oedothorax gibbosus]
MDAMKDKVITYLSGYNADCLNQTTDIHPNKRSSVVALNESSSTNNTDIYSLNQTNFANAMNETNEVYNPDCVSAPTGDEPPKKVPAKRGRKIKNGLKSQWRREKCNKYLNKPYKNYKGLEIKSKEFVDYDCGCQLKCSEVLSANDRKQEFQKFWELGSYEAQAIFLVARVDEQVTKRSLRVRKRKKKVVSETEDSSDGPDTDGSPEKEKKKKKDPEPEVKKSKRQFSRTYILKAKQVCRTMFIKTLGITSKRINTALVKMRKKSLTDHRGLSQGGKNRISDKRHQEVIDHIKKMPRYKCSHVQGKMDSEFLPPELSLSKMYDIYSKEVEQPVSLSMYKKVYYDKFSFKSKGSKREVCNICKGERKSKTDTSKKRNNSNNNNNQTPEKQQYTFPSSPEENIVLQQHQYRPNFIGASSINCNQSWLATPNFQMTQHNPTNYFEQQLSYTNTNFDGQQGQGPARLIHTNAP